jgi:hypothetical protein
MRAEDEWVEWAPTMTTGAASVSGNEPEPSDVTDFAAVLWIPDIEQRHGWRELYVKRPQPKPGTRPVGFRR